MLNKSIFILCISIIAICFTQSQEYVLKDGTKLKGTVLSESDTDLVVQTSFGAVTIKKSDLVLKEFNVKMLSGEVFKGTKQKETETEIHLLTNIGLLKLTKINISSIEEVGKVTSTGYVNNRRPRSLFGFLNRASLGKNTEFSIGEEQLIDLFFDPTGYTLKQGTFYLSGLSFGFGVNDNLQISTKWLPFIWGDMNIRPKFQIFKKGNWENEQSLSIGTHLHTRWWPNKYKWKSESININGEEKYWGGFYKVGDNPEFTYHDDDYNDFIRNDNGGDDNFVPMLEFFGAYTISKARNGLKGRISHTIGGNFQYVNTDEPLMFYRAYYGLDIDITPKVKMISEIFYDPNYFEFWQMQEYEFERYHWDVDELSNNQIDNPNDLFPIHLDFGFIYAVNESFRLGVHFQQPFVAFYWKI